MSFEIINEGLFKPIDKHDIAETNERIRRNMKKHINEIRKQNNIIKESMKIDGDKLNTQLRY